LFLQESEAHMFRWGVIGTGSVARKFVAGLRQSDGGIAVLAVGRDAARTASFARDFGIADSMVDLSAAVSRPDIDAFYIATPPTAHRDAALACIAAGKSVLIEKPMSASADDTAAIITAARAAGVFVMEGIWTRFLPLFTEMRARIQAGEIGDIRSLEASFGLSNIVDARDNQFNFNLGGGALLHRGLYPLALALDLLGPATLISSAATLGETRVDEDVVVVLRHDAGGLSTLRASLRAPLPNDITIEGTHGRIHIDAPLYRPWRASMIQAKPVLRTGTGKPRFEGLRESTLVQGVAQRLTGLRRRGTTITRYFTGNGYHYEADAAMAAIRAGLTECPVMPLADSLAIAEITEAARARWTEISK
jgi:predicted dehydrogenase